MQKSLVITAFAGLFALASCDNDKENGPAKLSKADAQAEIAEFNSTATLELQELADSKAVLAIADLSDLTSVSDPFGGRATTDKKKLKTFLRKKGLQFRSIFSQADGSGRVKAYEPFDFDSKKGVYEYNAVEGIFEKTGEGNIIEIHFPTEGSSSNNAVLELLAFEEEQLYDEFFEEYTWEPSLVEAVLSVDGDEVASVDLSVDWDESGVPVSGDFSATVVPFTASVSFDVTGSTKNTLSASLSRSSETLFAASISVNYSDASKSEEALASIEGFVQLKNLKLKGEVDVQGADAGGEEIDMNDFVKLQLLTSDDKKIGDIVFETETDVDGFEILVTYVKYSDGSKEKLEDVLQPVIDELDQLSEDIDNG